MKKLLLVLLVCISIVCTACNNDYDISQQQSAYSAESQSDTSYESHPETSEEVSQPQTVPKEYLDDALLLLQNDKQITQMFICGSLLDDYDPYNLEVLLLQSGTVYDDFSAIQDLLASTYSSRSTVPSDYLAYPQYGPQALSEYDGATYYTVHAIQDFDQFILPETFEIYSQDDDTLYARGYSSDGFEYDLTYQITDDSLRLDDSQYFIYQRQKPPISRDDVGYRAGGMDAGTCTTLTGRCLIINVFLNDSVSSWDDQAINGALVMQEEAFAFLQEQSVQFGRDLTIEYTDRNTSLFLTTNDKIPTDINNFVWIDLLFIDTIYGTLQGYSQANYNLDEYDNYCLFINLNKAGRSYTVPCNTEYSDHDLYYTERGVLYYSTDYSEQYYIVPSVYAHEFLHLFGAVDFYYPYLDGYELELLTLYMPDELMSVVYSDITIQTISPLTAFKIGWTDYLDEQFVKILNIGG